MELKDLDYDLGIMHVLYGLAFAFGFQELAGSLDKLISGTTSVTAASVTLSIFALNLAVVLIGLRFFWAIGNLRRFVKREDVLTPTLQIEMVVVHFPIVVLQSFAFYLLCAQVSHVLDQPETIVNVSRVGHFAAFLLFLNAIWLAILQRGVPRRDPERIWFGNNLVMAFVTLLISVAIQDATIQLWVITLTLMINSAVDLGLTSKWYLQSTPISKRKTVRA